MKITLTKYSFGATSAIITSLGLIIGLNSVPNAKLSIIGSLLVLALADNVADSMGIHIYQDSENISVREVWFSTITNFIARFVVSAFFIMFIIFLPINIAVIVSIFYGLLILSALSYKIAKNKNINPYKAVLEHLSIALIVIFISNYIGTWILSIFKIF